jgi:hypothetical protein
MQDYELESLVPTLPKVPIPKRLRKKDSYAHLLALTEDELRSSLTPSRVLFYNGVSIFQASTMGSFDLHNSTMTVCLLFM